ncbi:nucleoside-triphosphatase THEP1 [Danaus plexippus]|uniref:nucleoside-triphosphatase THEP1 n=1 Tax=Danaus plexippus TaxID=13037 RepID=UPI002AB009C7|nr:nucleoside-triphosphatase THEP1 [Danaus plexippus]
MFFILTGDSGVGKTTLIKKIVSILNKKGIKTKGFYTEEVRNNGVREGFDIVTLNGVRGKLARDQNFLTIKSKYTVGKYGVLVKEFEDISLASLEKLNCSERDVMVIDEIGKMEFFSTSFKFRIKDIFSSECENIVLATIPSRKSDPIIESIRNDKRSYVWMVTRENRNILHDEIVNKISSII